MRAVTRNPGRKAVGSPGRNSERFAQALKRLASRHPFLVLLPASVGIGYVCVHGMLAATGRPSAAIDDAYIHLQFARRIAEGSFFNYVAGEGKSTGATSPVWCLALAPFHLFGVRGLSLVWVTWILGTFTHTGVAAETARLVRRIAGDKAALGSALACLGFGAFAWHAWSGMETMAFAWVLLGTTRLAGEWCEPPQAILPTAKHKIALVACGTLAPLVRPEGVIAAAIAAVALWRRPRSMGIGRRWAIAAIPMLGAFIVPCLNVAFVGTARPSTATMKWLALSPYLEPSAVVAKTLENAWSVVTDVINAGSGSVFLPYGSAIVALASLLVCATQIWRQRLVCHGVFLCLGLLGLLLPCSYLGFDTNRGRYLWPFISVLFVCLGCLIGELAEWVGTRYPVFGSKTSRRLVIALGCLPWFYLPDSVADLGKSARAISSQQVLLAEWARDHLPVNARLGVNDAGALAYLSERRVVDLLGLVTEGEARYSVAGEGSRFEHYEHQPHERLPTHFIVYPEWVGHSMLFGKELQRATVTDQSILGGPTMLVFPARYESLGSGALPTAPPTAEGLVDEVDVSDLDSEASHEFELGNADYQENRVDEVVHYEGPPGASAEEIVRILRSPHPEGHLRQMRTTDAGRRRRTYDRFTLRVPEGPTCLVLRVAAPEPTELAISINGVKRGALHVNSGPWQEPSLQLAPLSAPGRVRVEIKAMPQAVFTSYHYWLYAPKSAPTSTETAPQLPQEKD